MFIKKKEIIGSLKESINRLEEVLPDEALISDDEEIGIDRDNLDIPQDMADDMESMEAALMIAESRIEEINQVLNEEIENLRTLMEKIEEEIE